MRAAQRAACSWDRHDLTDILAGLQSGTLQQPQPTVAGWLYARAVNGLAGESGSGKTWTALVSVALEIMAGNAVVYVDFEDGPIGITGRLLALGVPADVIAALFIYVRPDEAFRDDVRAGFWQMLGTARPTLVIIDSTGESMAIEGVDPNSDDGVARWFRNVATAIADRGPAVLLLDHLPKSDNAASSPIGSQRKRAAVSGVQIIQTIAKSMSFAKGRAGEAKLVCTKDRHGNFVTGEVVMRLIVNPEPARGEAGINAVLVHGAAEEFAHTRHMLNISQFVEQQGAPQTATAIKKAVTGKAETINAALAVLVASGYLSVTAGANRSKNYTLLKPYVLGDPYTVPDVAAGCGHPWHDGNATCNPGWCHPHHHGRCNERVAQGYVLDVDGDVIEEPLRHGAAGDSASPGSNLHTLNPWDSE
ncbi:MAG: AAA family ATPase [Actinobacteria bacterium]|nr:AAA family ATPase [Actinomycetota bacterium]